MKISRRHMMGTLVGGAVASQMPQEAASNSLNQANQQISNSLYADTPASTTTDPEYYSKQIKRCKKILSGDFSDCMYEFEDNTRGKTYGNIEALKSISATARQIFIESALNKRKKRELMNNARENLDRLLSLPFSVTGILFDE